MLETGSTVLVMAGNKASLVGLLGILLSLVLVKALPYTLFQPVIAGTDYGVGFAGQASLSLVLLYEDNTVRGFQDARLWQSGVLGSTIERDGDASYLVAVMVGPRGEVLWRQEVFVGDPQASLVSIETSGEEAFIFVFMPSQDKLRMYRLATNGDLLGSIDYPIPPTVVVLDAVRGPNATAMVAGAAYWLEYGMDYYVAMVSSSGVEWRILYGSLGDDLLYSVKKTSSGYFLFTGNNGTASFVLVTSSAGRVIVNETINGFEAYSAAEYGDLVILAGTLEGNAGLALLRPSGEPVILDSGVPGVAVDIAIAGGLPVSVIATPKGAGLPSVIAITDPGSAGALRLFNSSLAPSFIPLRASSLGDLIVVSGLLAGGQEKGVIAVYSLETRELEKSPLGTLYSVFYSPLLTIVLVVALSAVIFVGLRRKGFNILPGRGSRGSQDKGDGTKD